MHIFATMKKRWFTALCLIAGVVVSLAIPSGVQAAATPNSYIIAAANAPSDWKAKASVQCDGISDQAEINNALSAKKTNIVLSPGDFYQDNQITITISNVNISGNGESTIIHMIDNSLPNTVQIKITGSTVMLKNLVLDGNCKNQNTHNHVSVVSEASAIKLSITSVHIEYSDHYATFLRSPNLVISNCTINNTYGHALNISSGANSVTISGNKIYNVGTEYGMGDSGAQGINIDAGSNITITNNTIYNLNDDGAIVVFGGGPGKITNNTLDGDVGVGFIAVKGDITGWTVSGNTIHGFRLLKNFGNGIILQRVNKSYTITNNTISNNTINGAADKGIGIFGAASNTIQSNYIYDVGQRYFGVNNYGIIIAGTTIDGVQYNATKNVVKANNIKAGPESRTLEIGIYLADGVTNTTISENDVKKSGYNHGIYIQKGATNTSITSNTGYPTEVLTTAPAAITSDSTAPVLSGGLPVGTLPSGTTQIMLTVTTNELAYCSFSYNPGNLYGDHPFFDDLGGSINHYFLVTGLQNGQTYNFYIRGVDAAGNRNSTDYVVSFTVAG